jgi:hypothetical protein
MSTIKELNFMAAKRKSAPDRGIKGILEPFFETGTEGVIWSLQDEKHISADGKEWSYDGLNGLEDGDFLKVFNDAARKKVIWQGEIKLIFPPDLRYNRGVQDGVDKEAWTKMFWDAKPGILYKKEVYDQMKAEKAARAKVRADARAKKIADTVNACRDGVDVELMKPLKFKPRKPR